MIEEARAKAQSETVSPDSTDVPVNDANEQLPTPPNEPAPPVLPRRLVEASPSRWTTPGTASSPSSSPPPLDDVDPQSFDDAQLDDVLQTTVDPIALANRHFDYGSSKASPSSSIEAELDSDDERPRWSTASDVVTARPIDDEGTFGPVSLPPYNASADTAWRDDGGSATLRTVALPDAATAVDGILTPPPELQEEGNLGLLL
jgi:hypothetical protein